MLKTNFIPYIILVYPNTVAYDSKGNITSRKLYSGESLLSTDSFTYGTDSWEDRLTGYNNKTIAYDDVGNPVSYMGATLTWRGRELASYAKGNKQISYSYDVDGMRYRKVVKTDGVETARYDYVYSDGTLILLTYTANGASNTARFVYDSFGEPRGFILNNSSAYLYLKNAQGDITGIVDESGAVLLSYSYNAWGKVTYSATDMESLVLAGTLSNVNPFTYRGYCYDYDIGMYYLQSRYYDPTICRFINADSTDYLGATGTLLSYNLFAYCENDGVNFVDETGTSKRADLSNLQTRYGKKDSVLETFAKLLKNNGKNYYTAFHELAQILIAEKLSQKGYRVTLEKPCAKNKSCEIDVYASRRSILMIILRKFGLTI